MAEVTTVVRFNVELTKIFKHTDCITGEEDIKQFIKELDKWFRHSNDDVNIKNICYKNFILEERNR